MTISITASFAVISGTGIYAVAYDDSQWGGNSDVVTLPLPCGVRGLYLNNTTYAALDMLNGDVFSKKFGGADGNDADWFKLTITGRN